MDGMKRRIGVWLLLPLLAVFSACGAKKPVESKTTYTCPMHPSYTSDKPGDCPICGMTLVPVKPRGGAPAAATPRKTTMYRSTMNPGEVSDHPGKDSMGMEMVPFEASSEPGTAAGLAAVTLSPEAQKMLGVTFGTVAMGDLGRDILTSARIVADETRKTRVSAKVDGWVERLYADVPGQFVRRGQPLLSLYSPELVAAQQELLTAMALNRDLGGENGRELVAAARRKLQLWDIGDAQVARVAATGTVQKSLSLLAPASGYVLEKTVLPGQRIMAGEALMTIADFSRVWAMADLYEQDLAEVKPGMEAELTLPPPAGRTYTGRIVFVEPQLDPQTRTVRARLDIANPGLELKPEMLARARLRVDLGRRLLIPAAAVLQSGDRAYAFRQAADGRLQPIELRLGARNSEFIEILSGLSAGERVVTSANFLIDSESSLKAALEQAVQANDGGGQ